jgi:hypothetical protein
MSTVSRQARRNCVTSVSKLYETMPHARTSPQPVRPRVAVGNKVGHALRIGASWVRDHQSREELLHELA